MALIIKNRASRRTTTGPWCAPLKTARCPQSTRCRAGKVIVPFALWKQHKTR